MAFSPSVYIFSSCFHFSGLSVVCSWYLVVSVSLAQDTHTHGLCLPLNFPLRLMKESEFRTSEGPTTAITSVTISRRKKGPDSQYYTYFPLEEKSILLQSVTPINGSQNSNPILVLNTMKCSFKEAATDFY